MENKEVSKKNKSGKLKFVLIIFFIIMLIVTSSLLYFNNETFKSKIDNLLAKLPWTTVKNTDSSLTESEMNAKKEDLAQYYLSLERENAADKLYIVKNDDEILYSEIIKKMNSNSSSKTGEIIQLVREIGLREGLLASIHDEIIEENQNLSMNEVSRLENQDILVTIDEIENRIVTDNEFKENLPNVFNFMDEQKATNILYYIDEGVREEILYLLTADKRASIENKLLAKTIEHTKLTDLASLYETKPIEVALEEIGNTETYSVEELGTIYNNLSILRSAEILSKSNDDVFVQELFAAIRQEEQLNGEETATTNEINRGIQFITEYNNKIDDLVTVYENMDPDKVARIVEQMIDNNATVTAFEIDAEPVFEISDSSIIIDVLSRMRNKTLSEIINYATVENASRLTQMLARP